MSGFINFVSSYLFIAVFVAWISSVFLKFVIKSFRGEINSFSSAFSNGGMPSSHSALVASLSAGIYMLEGLTPTFFISLVFAVIVMSDAVKVRKNLGEQGDTLNKLLLKLKQHPITIVHGHSSFQVLIGAMWGIFVSVGIFGLMFA
ncbi:MAG: divergent PAP2 family protein [Candidatus Woesearchaeota archaeon]|jgi:hypothetical protein